MPTQNDERIQALQRVLAGNFPRLQLALEQLQRERGERCAEGWRVRATQAELAALAGVTRQTANEWLRAQGLRSVYGHLLLR